MFKYLSAENIKIRHTFLKKIIWMGPIATILLSYSLAADYFQVDNYNWWYITILPVILSLSCALIIEEDKKMNNRAVLSMPISLTKVWVSKVLAAVEILSGSSMIIFCGSQLVGFLTGMGNPHAIPAANALIGTIIIIITFMWQIPLCMFLDSKIGLFPTILLNTALNIAFGVTLAVKSAWVFSPYAYPSRLMCPVLKILPNGLEAVPGSQTFTPELLSYNVILPGVLISIALFIILTYITAKWFGNQEGK